MNDRKALSGFNLTPSQGLIRSLPTLQCTHHHIHPYPLKASMPPEASTSCLLPLQPMAANGNAHDDQGNLSKISAASYGGMFPLRAMIQSRTPAPQVSQVPET